MHIKINIVLIIHGAKTHINHVIYKQLYESLRESAAIYSAYPSVRRGYRLLDMIIEVRFSALTTHLGHTKTVR